MNNIRQACVAGQFYPAKPSILMDTVRGFLSEGEKEKAIAIIAPHAGYIYSGAVAGKVYSSVKVPGNIILLGPNHTGHGKRVSLMAEGAWETPLGVARINSALASKLLASCPLFSEDTKAHLMEHSLEVQLPFILSLNPEATIVPITVMQADLKDCEAMGKAIAGVVSSWPEDVLIVVSSDMNHYESEATTRKKDRLALDEIERLDPRGLFKVVSAEDITMCGILPAMIALSAAKDLNAKGATVIKYSTSGETSGDFAHVVGYAGVVIK